MSTTIIETEPRVRRESRTDRPRLWNVVLLDDDEHTYEYVIHLVQNLFGHSLEHAFQLARSVDTEGRAVCMTTHLELAELKREQIQGFGADPLLAGESTGPMRARIEPVED